MSGAEAIVTGYFLNSLWQVPLIAGVAFIAALAVRPLGPLMEHRVWVGALFGEALLPGISLLPWDSLNLVLPWRLQAQQSAQANVTVQMGSGVGFGGLELPPLFIDLMIFAYAAVTLYLAARFVWRCLKLSELVRTSELVRLDDDVETIWRRWSIRFGADRVALVSSRRIFAPLTMGIINYRIMLPAEMIAKLSTAEFDTVIGHELAHVRRLDFMKNLLYELIAITVSYHPALWFTRQRLTESREMVCDAIAAQVSGSMKYAQSLLKLAGLLLQGKNVGVPHAIGVFDSSTLERRLMKLTEIKEDIGRVRRGVALAACVVLGVAAATSAVALRIGVQQNSQGTPKKTVDSVSVNAKVMSKQLLTKITPVYPPEAKAAKIQGKVVLNAVIGKDGHVENLKVVSGPKELQQSALDAVRQWVYKPYLLNGSPVEVMTDINVIYTLAK
jgi:TonB family protein